MPLTSAAHASLVGAALVLLGAAAFVGCARSEPARDDASARRGETATPKVERAELTVVDGKLERTPWALGNRIYGLPGGPTARLGGAVNAPLTGTLSPAAVASAGSRRLIAYNAFLGKRPVLRVYDVARNEDRVVDEGTFSLAWSRKGALAYFKGLKPEVQDPARHVGHVLVRPSLRAAPVRWTSEPGPYVVSAWARERLVVHERQGDRWPDLVVLDGPRRKRVLAEGAALVALSPDGTRAFVSKRPDSSPAVAVVEIETGDELATFTFSDETDPVRGQPITYVADSGAWASGIAIAAVTGGLAIFRVADAEIVLEELLGVDPDAFPLGLTEPKADTTGRYVVAAAQLQQRPRAAFTRVALMECDRIERRCVLDRSGPVFLPPHSIYNPSRPLGG